MVTDEYVCETCGVPVTVAKSGRLVHLDEVPRGTDEHEIVAVSRETFQSGRDSRSDLQAAAEDMLLHHDSIHPASDCDFSLRLHRALRTS